MGLQGQEALVQSQGTLGKNPLGLSNGYRELNN